MTDQLRRDALGCYGNSLCKTPNLDRVAATGACFENAFTVSPVCSPARASLLTGLYPHNHGVMLNTHIAPAWSPGLSPELPTFSRILNDSGYVLDYVGKWHVHKELLPEHFGFARAVEDGFGGPRPELVTGSQIAIDFQYGARQLIAGTVDATASETRLMQRTQAGIAADSGTGRRHAAVHGPDGHARAAFPLPAAGTLRLDVRPRRHPALGQLRRRLPRQARRPPEEAARVEPWRTRTGAWWSQVVAKYYGVVTQIDDCVGEVLAALDELGIADETIFVFCTDHGDAMGSHGHFEKAGTMYDEIFRVPLLMAGPQALGRAEPRPGVRALTGPDADLRRVGCRAASRGDRREESRGVGARRSGRGTGRTRCTASITAKCGATSRSAWCARAVGSTSSIRTPSMSFTT